MTKSLLPMLLCLVAAPLMAQVSTRAPSGSSATVQPRIMVIPRVREGQDIRTVLDADIGLRIAATKVKETFDRRGFSTVDFVGRLKAANEIGLFTSNSQSDVREQIIQFSGADIYVEVENSVSPSPQGNSALVIMAAYEASTGTSLANKIGNSGRFYGAPDDQLIQRAVDSAADEMLNTMQAKFSAMLEEGRSVLVDISVKQTARTTFEDSPAGKEISYAELLEAWFSGNAFHNSFHLQGVTATRILLDDVRLPLRDPVTGRYYGTNQFGSALASYMRSLGLSVTRELKGNTIFIVVTAP